MKGGDTTGLRAYNARLIVSEIRQAGALSKAEIARRTGLSGQAASVIVNALLNDGVLRKEAKVRGQVGQPSTPYSPNPRGAFSIGVKIGRRSLEVMLVDFLGRTLERREQVYDAPYPDSTLARARELVAEVRAALSDREHARIVGVGVAMPYDLHEWAAELDIPSDALAGWRSADVAAALARDTGLPTTLYNDATAACAAEMIVGATITASSALYVYIGTFVGGGVVLDRRLHRGAQANAGAIGSVPLGPVRAGRAPPQLIEHASLIYLERALTAAGHDAGAVIGGAVDGAAERIFADWRRRAIPALAQTIVGARGIFDFETVVVDGFLPTPWRTQVVAELTRELAAFNPTGLSPATLHEGSIGPAARVVGAALLPLNDRFSPDTDLLVRNSHAQPEA
ncbi:ROK family protein [Rhodobacteraceae bacterium 2CG4]|uniref:ROK family protein n=1 Tax=Halovulum marinum TaxID=2662447 RepID=A0A6L5Z231_9RHOB|nr:ROK family transcriptional regulator [Halovulum marinum]MSU90130.1 ROK family protein [Halovulum marinum]